MRRWLVPILVGAVMSAVGAEPRYRIAVGGITAESNAFYPATTTIAVQTATPRESWLKTAAASRGVLGGEVEAAGRLGLDLHPILTGGASYLGTVDTASFDTQVGELVRQLTEATPPYDGVLLNLHGAMVVENYPHGDAELVRRVRRAMGPRFPVVVLHDFHANVPPEIVADSTVLITYKEHPHVDARERGVQAASLLARVLNGEVKPVQRLVKPPLLLNLIHQNTLTGLLKPIVAESRRLERDNPRVLAVSVPGGYQWADVPHLGPSVIVVTDNDVELAAREAARLAELVYGLRDRLSFDLPDAASAVRMARESNQFPVVIMDTGDNIGGGSAGDSTYVLEELLRQNAGGWVMSLADPAGVDVAAGAGIGGRFDFAVGAKHDDQHGKPIRVRGVVRSLQEDANRPKAAAVSAAVIALPAATAAAENLLVLTRRASGLRSVEELTRNGIAPMSVRIIVSKGTVAPFETFQAVAARFIMAASPGPTDVNLSRFRFTRAIRPLYGLP